MACQSNFDSSIPYPCLLEIVADFRNGAAPLALGKKLAWTLGCVCESFDGEDERLMGAAGDEDFASASDEELLERLEGFATDHGQAMASAPGAKVRLPAWLVPLLLNLLQRWLAGTAG